MARSHSKAAQGVYLYAVSKASVRIDEPLAGIAGGSVYALVEGDLAAILSDVDQDKIRPERRNIAAHQDVLRRLTAADTVLPMAFGTVAESRKAVSKMLKTYQSRLVKQLRELGGKVEMGLRVALDAPDVYEYLIAQSPEILALRDQMALRGGGAHSEKIELGRQFAELLEDTRSASFEKIEAALAPFCFEIHSNTVMGDKEIANLAFLVDREKLPEFERGVEKIADEFDDRFTFQYSGPWAPYNFVNMELDL